MEYYLCALNIHEWHVLVAWETGDKILQAFEMLLKLSWSLNSILTANIDSSCYLLEYWAAYNRKPRTESGLANKKNLLPNTTGSPDVDGFQVCCSERPNIIEGPGPVLSPLLYSAVS